MEDSSLYTIFSQFIMVQHVIDVDIKRSCSVTFDVYLVSEVDCLMCFAYFLQKFGQDRIRWTKIGTQVARDTR